MTEDLRPRECRFHISYKRDLNLDTVAGRERFGDRAVALTGSYPF